MPRRIKTITEYNRLRDLPKPEHPLISVVNMEQMPPVKENEDGWVLDFYSIALKRHPGAKIKYGQQQYDFNEGLMFFISPGQVFKIEVTEESYSQISGWLLLVHPDFLWNTPLAKSIRQYEYFGYSVNEALFLSDKEESIITGIIQNIQQEYHSNIDKFSQNIIIAQLELLLSYAERFYNRQFITRKITNHEVLNRLEEILDSAKGLPSVQSVADALHMSPGYLSSMLKVLTGQTTQQHIHNKLIDKAKAMLSTTELSVSEIAYELGFEHPQSFSKLFKTKTDQSPQAFRQSFH